MEVVEEEPGVVLVPLEMRDAFCTVFFFFSFFFSFLKPSLCICSALSVCSFAFAKFKVRGEEGKGKKHACVCVREGGKEKRVISLCWSV